MNKIVAMVGMTGSGKSIASGYLKDLGWPMIYFGGITYEKMKEEGIPYSPENEKKMRVRLREEHGMAAYAKLSLPKIREAYKTSNVIIDDLYSWAEYKLLKDEFGDNVILIAIVIDKNIRYDRLKIRESRPYTKEEAIDRDLNEIEKLDKGGPIAYADYFILNDGSIEDYIIRLEEIINIISSN